MSEKKQDQTIIVEKGTSISGLLGVAFVILKLTWVIDWSWWWVTSPFWIPVVLILAIWGLVIIVPLVILFILFLIGLITDKIDDKKKGRF